MASSEKSGSSSLPPELTEWSRRLVETVKDYAVFLLDPAGMIGTWNLGVQQVLGYTPEEWIGQHFSICYLPHDIEAGKPQRELEIAAAEGRYSEQGWRFRKGGMRFWADEVITALFDDTGRLTGYGKLVRDLSERRDAEELLRTAVEHALDGVITIDEHGTIQTFNRQAERTFGYSASEVAGRNVSLLMPEPYHSEHDGYIESYLRTGVAKVIGIGREIEGRRKDGSTFPLQLVVSEFQLHDRRHFMGSVRDISGFRHRLRQAEELARLGESALKNAADDGEFLHQACVLLSKVLGVGPIGILELLPDGQRLILRAGTLWQEGLVGTAIVDAGPVSMTGYTLSMSEPVVVSDLKTETRFTPDPRLLDHGIVSGVSVILHGMHRPFGALVVFSRDARTFAASDVSFVQSVANIVAAFIQRQQLEVSLRRANQDLQQIVDSNIVGIAFWRPDGRITAANDYFLDLLRLRREDIARGSICWPDMTPPEYASLDSRAVDDLRASGRFAPFEKELIRSDGVRVPILVGGALLAGETDRGVAFILDLSERRRLEMQARQAQKMEAMGRLAGGVAHDFNNLLTVITGFTEMMLYQRPTDDPMYESLSEIAKAALHGGTLTQQLLAFSRQQVLAPKVLDLKELVTNIEKMLNRLLGEDVILETTHEDNLGCVRADRGQMEQVIVNLAVNARDAMPQGGRLTIATRNVVRDEPGDTPNGLRHTPYVMLSVTDTGHGMDAVTKAGIFEPFFTTKGPGKGTGLGLSTVYGIVNQSGGAIDIDSAPDAGTTIKVYLPRVEDVAAPPPVTGNSSLPRGTETILVVEDEPGVRALLRRMLGSRGYKVLEATNGAEALELIEQHTGPLDLVVSDVVMPHLGGRPLYERLAASRPGLKVMFLSGYTDDAVVRQGILSDRVPFLQKPFTAAALAQKVRQVLDSRE